MVWVVLLPICCVWAQSMEEPVELLGFDEVFEEEMAFDDEDFFDEDFPLEEEAPSEISAAPAAAVMVDETPSEMVSLPEKVDALIAQDLPIAPLEKVNEAVRESSPAFEINLRQVFAGSPIIYSILFFLSVVSVCVWLYSMLTVRSIEFLPKKLIQDLRTKLVSNQFNEALDLCVKERHFFCKMLASGILARKHGLNMMVDTMKSEGKRSTISFWQRIGILNEIAIISPLLGLLGTVMGMFYAFYDLNRSIESVSLLFDGLGISVGTTVAGLIVAILAMILHSIAKYRLVKILASVENEAQTFAALIDTRAPAYLEHS